MNKKKRNMKDLMHQFEDIMAASAFAEGGVFETAREMLRGRQKVLLVLTGKDSDRKSFKYAFNICKRIDTGLEILYISGSEIAGLLDQFEGELKKEGIAFEIIQVAGCIKEAIINHTEKKRNIQLVVIESSDILDIECEKDNRMLSKAWERLKCPLVVVSKNEVPSPA
jgi:pyruvate/2-oxoglutarate/acetoin dehydrogenase E1 component